jgi:Zn-dependent protease with chaperone function
MTLPAEGYRLTRISSKAYEHPADRAATAALSTIPYLEKSIRRLIDLGYERALRQSYLGSAVRLGEDQLPDVWRTHNRAYATLDIAEVPDLYLTQFPLVNAATIGSQRPIVVANSETIRLLDTEQLRAVFAHEAGHVLSDHVLYSTALAIVMALGSLTPIALPLRALRGVLLEWHRAAELSCDRAAALVTRDPETVCRTLMTMAAGAEAENLNLDAFMRQGLEYSEKGIGIERLVRLMIDLNLTHPMSVRRVHELLEWVKNGDYDRIVGGSYVSRDDPVRPRAEASDAVAHYAERFRNAFADAGESISAAGKQLSDWLRRQEDEE